MAIRVDLLPGGHTFNGTNVGDSFFGQDGGDILNGAGGADLLNGGVGDDVLNGGDGIDTADYSNGTILDDGNVLRGYTGATAGVRVDLNIAVAQNTGGAGRDTLIGIENIKGTAFTSGDTLIGNDGANRLEGLAGNDCLFGNAGADHLFGGVDGDVLNGGAGADLLDGGGDADTASYIGAAAAVTLNLGVAGAQAGAGGDTLIRAFRV